VLWQHFIVVTRSSVGMCTVPRVLDLYSKRFCVLSVQEQILQSMIYSCYVSEHLTDTSIYLYIASYLIQCIVLSRYAVSMLDFSKAYRIVGTDVGNDTFKSEFESELKQN